MGAPPVSEHVSGSGFGRELKDRHRQGGKGYWGCMWLQDLG